MVPQVSNKKCSVPELTETRLPDDFSYDEGALLEPLSVAIQAARKATIEPETRCLVIGAGAVGLLCSTVARRKGCRNIVMTDIAAPRLEFARENGFATACLVTQARPKGELAEDLSHAKHLAQQLLEVGDDAVQDRGGFDVVFECTGVESCVRLAIYVSYNVLISKHHAHYILRQHLRVEQCFWLAWVLLCRLCICLLRRSVRSISEACGATPIPILRP